MPNPKRKPPRDIAQEITDKLIARLEEGGPLPWRRPWRSSTMAMPLRHTGAAYKGVNHLLLSIETYASGYTTPYWMTFRQAKELGGMVRKGERSSTVVYYGTAEKKGASGDQAARDDVETDSHYRFLKGYAVFNADQVDGLPERFHPAHEEIDTGARSNPELDAFFARMPFAIRTGLDHAAYREMPDEIVMPDVSRFETAGEFYATLGHESIHGTGSKYRLERDCFARYHTDKEARAAEELIAEIGAMMLTAHLGINGEHIDDHAAYISSWLKILKSEKRHIFKAAAEAQRACDWVLAKGGRAVETPPAAARAA